jgi:hypothetical protein
MPIIPARRGQHCGDRHQGADKSEIVNDAVSCKPDAKHGDGKNNDADQD